MRAPRARRPSAARRCRRAKCMPPSSPRSMASTQRWCRPMSYEPIKTEQKGRVGLITLNRPKQLNALNPQLMQELGAALYAYDAGPGIGAVVITGKEKASAAGADIGVMKDYSYMDAFMSDYITRDWEHIRRIRKPVIAAVAGYALGGGNELAMMCDIVIAAENAK